MDKAIYSVKQYGYIEIELKKYMEIRKISRNALARAVGTRFEVINKWYSGHIEKIDTDILARICFVLDCSPADIIRYVENDKENGKN